jgi:4-hydroxy-tetrahydrodipicolinate synthase
MEHLPSKSTATAEPSDEGSARGPAAPFGRLMTAMITPMTSDGAVDDEGAARLAEYLVGEMRNDGLVVSGTTGESPTTTDAEKDALLRAVVEAVGDRAVVVAGVGTSDTAHSCALARQAERAGAAGLLVVTPYYSKPPQAGLVAHFSAVADASGLPVMLYDIPGRTGTAIATQTLLELAGHPRIVAVKDAKGDLVASSVVMAGSGLAYYCGDDPVNLPWLAIGACGLVSVHGHVVGDRLHELIDAYAAGRVGVALRLHRELGPVYAGMTRAQGVVMAKAALGMLGLPGGPVRPPLVNATPAETEQLRADLAAGGVKLQ